MKKSLILLALAGGAVAGAKVAQWRRLSKLAGMSVVVTGGSRGLGLALARCAVAHGARVAICARDPQEVAEARELLLREYPGAMVLAATCDVTDRSESERFVSAAVEQFGTLDILINCAGVIQVGPWQSMGTEDYREAIETHVWGPLNMILAAHPALRRRRGRIVNIASIGGKIGVPHLLPYTTSKFALVGLSEGLAAELDQQGITVTTVCPGLMRTGSPRNAWFRGQHRQEYAWFSIGASLPGLTVGASSAARRILAASLARRRHLVFPLPARLAAIGRELAPGWTARISAAVNARLPSSTEADGPRRRGSESTSPWSPSPLTYLNDRAANVHNQVPPS
ncbi:MAG: SDR family NAD(P)-dependent oxidoreductase [Planctomycetota bacterium]|nr:MAG: SDR family NAD(P)-dependent oxidoreductase [Planctomycetota bacterium]